MLFALLAIKIKDRAPGSYTFPEIIMARHGRVAHATYLFNGLVTNMLVGASLVLGASQVVSALCGMNVYAACFLIISIVAVYVITGGLRSTFIGDYAHTVILSIAIFVFGFGIYATNDVVGSFVLPPGVNFIPDEANSFHSPSRFYDLLMEASEKMPIAENYKGSYLTFKSIYGLSFAIDLLVGGFATSWLDQAYWQRAIASRPETSTKAYILGGCAGVVLPSRLQRLWVLDVLPWHPFPLSQFTLTRFPKPRTAQDFGFLQQQLISWVKVWQSSRSFFSSWP